MNHRIKSVEVTRYPVLRVTFEDDLSGDYDLTTLIETGGVFAALKDDAYFRSVGIAEYGHSFGWNLDQLGEELDFCPDATRIRIETRIVESLAARYAACLAAAE